MRDGFARVAALAPSVRVADVDHNVEACAAAVRAVTAAVGEVGTGAQVVVLPELAITAYTCEDLFWQDALLSAADKGLADFARRTADLNALLLVGLPVRVNAKLYNCCAVVCGGIGPGAIDALSQLNILPLPGVTGSADQAAQDFAAGKLVADPDALCHHHDGGHTCGHHGEGHGCGGSCH